MPPTPVRFRIKACLLLLLAGAGTTGLAQSWPPTARPSSEQPRTYFSTSRRFVVTGFAPDAAPAVARWAEDVARRLEEALGPIPLDRGWYLEVQATPGQPVVRAQGWVDGLLQQRLDVDPGDTGDQEDALEGLVWLLLNRWPVARQSHADRAAALAVVPDWLAVGMAQTLYVELRSRNAGAVQERLQQQLLTPWSDLVEREIMPAGRWSEKGELGLLVAWLLERRAPFEAAWARWAEGKRLRADEVAQLLAGLPSAAEGARSWEVWLVAQQDRVRDIGGLTLAQVDEFSELTSFDEAELLSVQADAEGPLMAADLVAQRRAPWVPTLAMRRSLRIQMAMVGRAPEWQDVARQYLTVMQGLASQSRGRWGGLIGRGSSRASLEEQLAEADQALARLRNEVQARTDYLNRVEARLGQPGWVGIPDPEEEVRRYLDAVEQRRATQTP